MACHRPGDKPLSEPMMVSLPTYICVTRPQWFNAVLQLLGLRMFLCPPSGAAEKIQRFTTYICVITQTRAIFSNTYTTHPGPFQCTIRHLIIRCLKVSKPGDLYLELSHHFETWQAPAKFQSDAIIETTNVTDLGHHEIIWHLFVFWNRTLMATSLNIFHQKNKLDGNFNFSCSNSNWMFPIELCTMAVVMEINALSEPAVIKNKQLKYQTYEGLCSQIAQNCVLWQYSKLNTFGMQFSCLFDVNYIVFIQ